MEDSEEQRDEHRQGTVNGDHVHMPTDLSRQVLVARAVKYLRGKNL